MSASPFTACPACETPVVDLDSHMHRAHVTTSGRRERRCAYCDAQFSRDHTDQEYCSRDCANRACARRTDQ